MLDIDTIPDTFTRHVKVRFAIPGGAFREGQFTATYKRLPKDRLDELLDPEAGYTQNDVLDEVLVGAGDIGKDKDHPLSSDEALVWVRRSVEASNAAFATFFTAMRQEVGDAKTSAKRR